MSGKGFTRGLAGRADLVRARQLGDPALEAYLAGSWAMNLSHPNQPPSQKVAEPSSSPGTATPAAPVPQRRWRSYATSPSGNRLASRFSKARRAPRGESR